MTGFGLIGHLGEMTRASQVPRLASPCLVIEHCQVRTRHKVSHAPAYVKGCCVTLQVSVQLDVDSIPLMDGALQCADSGVASSLLPSNLKAAALVENAQEAARLGQWPLLFDPQTSGGLLGGWGPPCNYQRKISHVIMATRPVVMYRLLYGGAHYGNPA